MTVNVNFLYDKLNSFGSLAAAGDFPDTINLGEASIERMAVDLKLPLGAFTGSLTLTIKGCDTESGTYANIVASGTITAAMINGGYGLPVPKTSYKFIKAAIAGTFTGTVEAIINSHLGK
jgi:hypothetical protein